MSTSVPATTPVGSVPEHPARFDVEYPERELNRLTTVSRPIVATPIAVVLTLFRRNFPRWWFEFSRELVRFCARMFACLTQLDDRCRSTDEQQAARFEIRTRMLSATSPVGCRW